MPVPTILRRAARDDDHVSLTDADLVVTAGAAVLLDGLVRLHPLHVDGVEVVVVRKLVVHGAAQLPNSAQARSSPITTSATATITTSLERFTCERNGLKPTAVR
jgi:hypothetical protein